MSNRTNRFKQVKFECLETRALLTGVPELVYDINQTTVDSSPSNFVSHPHATFFFADDGLHGRELWRTDGTSGGTRLVKDIHEGAESSIEDSRFDRGSEMININGRIYFTVLVDRFYHHLWTTDGTEEGTVEYFGRHVRNLLEFDGRLAFIEQESLYLSSGIQEEPTQLTPDGVRVEDTPTSFAIVNDTLFFAAYDDENGYELWQTNGTKEGTSLVKDIWAGSTGSEPRSMTVVNDTLFFVANDGASGFELWKSNGTAAGTQMVRDIAIGESGAFESGFRPDDRLIAFNDSLFFVADDKIHGKELWQTDGTEGGTSLFIDFESDPEGAFDSVLTGDFNVLGQRLLFFADSEPYRGIWGTDGTVDGTYRIDDRFEFAAPQDLTAFGDHVYFSAYGDGLELWMSDGTTEGTKLVKDIFPGRRSGLDFRNDFTIGDQSGDTFFFSANNGLTGQELWQSDGTESGTKLVADINGRGEDSYVRRIVELDGTLFFTADDGIHGEEIWAYDPKQGIPRLVKDIVEEPAVGSSIRSVTAADGQIFFVADDEDLGEELWRSDGTEQGTYLVKDIRDGYVGSFNTCFGSCETVDHDQLTAVDDRLFFTPTHVDHGRELWITDGTENGTMLVKDIRPGGFFSDSHANYLTDVNGILYFSAFDDEHRTALWKSDPTTLQTELVFDPIEPPFVSRSIRHLLPTPIGLFFTAIDETYGHELWKLDANGEAHLVKDIHPGRNNGFEDEHEIFDGNLIYVDGTLFFTAEDGENGWKLWKTDGTSDGTVMVPGQPNDLSLFPTRFAAAGSRVIFTGRDFAHGEELWVSDGTESGTKLLWEFTPGRLSTTFRHVSFSNRSDSIEVDGSVYFTANGDLWRTNGTPEGTEMIVEVDASVEDSFVLDLIYVEPYLYFTQGSAEFGRELWRIELDTNLSVPGDSNHDGKFTPSDLVKVFQAGKYETGQAATWEEGDWNGDGIFSSSDLVTVWTAGAFVDESTPLQTIAAAIDLLFLNEEKGGVGNELLG